MQPYVGHNISIGYGFSTTADYANKLGANFYQIFLSNPQQYSNKRHSDLELEELNIKLKTFNMKIVIHSSYLINFSAPIDSSTHQKAVLELCKDLNDSVKLGAIGVIIHMGRKTTLTEQEATDNFVIGVKSVLAKTKDSTIIFETASGKGSEICHSMLKFRSLYMRFSEAEKARISFCIDTCHVFSAGYHLGDPDYVDVFCNLISDLLCWNKVACIHLNDSHNELNSKTDHHADITKGNINQEGLKKFVQACAKNNVPIVLETPCKDLTKAGQIDLVKQWISESEF